DLRMINTERNDTETHHDARVWTACRWPIQIAFGLTKTRRISHLLNHWWLCYPINQSGGQHRKDLEEEDSGLSHCACCGHRCLCLVGRTDLLCHGAHRDF